MNDTSWTDYPMVSLTHDELFITVNLLKDNTSWQIGWKQSIVWQIDKSCGYSGTTLNTQLHTDIENNGRRIRNLCPVKGGSQLYGPDMYFVSDRNLDVQNDTFFLVHITDTIGAAGQQLITLALISPSSYFVPVSGVQPDPADSLATNDARVLGAFLENDRIQFVGNTTDTTYGTSAFYHGVIHDVSSSPNISFQIISDDTTCYGYPNLSYAGDGASDHTAIINVLRSSSVRFLGYSAFVTDGNGNYSIEKNVKSGLGWHGLIVGTERWGDYSGSQRKYDEPGVVWVNGSYGRLDHKISTWIAELSLEPLTIGVEEMPQSSSAVLVYPNPASEQSVIEFRVDHYAFCSFDLLDVNGRVVKNLMEEMVKPGVNRFSFSMQPLASGIYFLRILSPGEIIATQKLVKE